MRRNDNGVFWGKFFLRQTPLFGILFMRPLCSHMTPLTGTAVHALPILLEPAGTRMVASDPDRHIAALVKTVSPFGIPKKNI